MANTITWFEIPAKDLHRATDFYSKLLARKLEQTDALGMPYVFLDPSGNGVSGALVGERGSQFSPHIAAQVRRYREAIHFYRDVLGMKLEHQIALLRRLLDKEGAIP